MAAMPPADSTSALRQHVIVVGAYSTSVRLVEELSRAGEQLLVLAHGDVTSDVVTEVQALGGHVIMADNVRESHLRLAGVERAKAVVILGDDDVRAIR